MEAPPPKKRSRWLFYLAAAVALLLGAAIAIPNFVKARTTSCKNACINNLRQIDGAKEQWALENKKPDGAIISKEDEAAVDQYIKGGKPKCPSDDPKAAYVYNPVGVAPSCTFLTNGVASHKLIP